jgi:hypothetical protein
MMLTITLALAGASVIGLFASVISTYLLTIYREGWPAYTVLIVNLLLIWLVCGPAGTLHRSAVYDRSYISALEMFYNGIGWGSAVMIPFALIYGWLASFFFSRKQLAMATI